MKIEPPPMIDEILHRKEILNSCQVAINGKWYVARSLPYYSWTKIVRQCHHAWLVLVGKAIAIQYAQDQIKRNDE